MGECGASISQTLCIPPDGSGGDHLCVLCSTTYSVCTCVSAHAPPLCHRAMYLLLPPRSTKHLLQIISREKNSRNKVRTRETLKNRILLLRERKRKNRKRATTIIVETFAGETFLSTRLLRTHISIFHSNPKPAPIQMDPGSRRKIRPPPLLDPPPSKRIRTRASNPSKRPRLSVPRHVHRLCSLLFSAKGACSRGWPRRRRRRWRRCACCVRACSIRCVGAESRPRERIQM